MSDIDKPLPNDAPNVTLTLRMIMTGKEVGSIIGKGGEIINNIREESGAKIHISDGSVPERLVSVSGPTDSIFKAFNMMSKKFDDESARSGRGGGGERDDGARDGGGRPPQGPVTFRLVVPSSQCGSLIGKGGSKIKEIRESTGASVQVASDMLANSTERSVTINGSKDAIGQAIYAICCVMLESPPKGTTIPYSPKALSVLGGGGGGSGGGRHGGRGSLGGGGPQDNPLASLLALSSLGSGSSSSTLAAIASIAGSQLNERHSRRDSRGAGGDDGGGGRVTQNYEMSIPNEMIGCVIGKGGSKIAEIRQLSGATIRISKSDAESSSGDDAKERTISISGNADSVALAKSLINMSIDLHKSSLEEKRERGGGDRDGRDEHRGGRDHRERGGGSGGLGGGGGGLGGLAQILANKETLTALQGLAALQGALSGGGGPAGILGALSGAHGGVGGPLGQVSGVHRARGGHGGGSRRDNDDRRGGGGDYKRTKFQPY